MYIAPKAGVLTTSEREIKRSRFLSFVQRVTGEDQAREFIQQIKAEFPDARHHCSAFIVAVAGANPVERSSDDGEPAGTAGQPMLEVLRGSGLCDVAVVVVRYFGGVKLGTGGLVRAYSDAVATAVAQVPRVRRELRTLWEVSFSHAEVGRVEAELRARGVDVVGVRYAAEATLTVAVTDDAALVDTLAAVTRGAAKPVRCGSDWREFPIS